MFRFEKRRFQKTHQNCSTAFLARDTGPFRFWADLARYGEIEICTIVSALSQARTQILDAVLGFGKGSRRPDFKGLFGRVLVVLGSFGVFISIREDRSGNSAKT